MAEIILAFILIVVGYILGIAGFFRAGIATGETRRLRALLMAEIAKRNAAAEADTSVARPAAPRPAATEEHDTAKPEAVEPASGEPEAGQDRPPPEPTRRAEPKPRRTRDLESVLTMRWGVWLGAAALLLAAVFLIRYAADQGLLGPVTRCNAAALLGVALLAAAEKLRGRVLPKVGGSFEVDQAPGALAAGGVAALFAAAYGAGPFYNLLNPPLGFAAMAAAASVGLLASLRFGPLTAAIGIVGAFVSPALVTSDAPSLIGLCAYLAVVTAAAQAVLRRTAWAWLGWAVTIAGAAWVALLATQAGDPQFWAVAALVPAAAFLVLLLPAAALDTAPGLRLAWGQFAIMAGAGSYLDLVAPNVAPRAALFALTPLAIWRALGEARLDRLPWIAAGCGLLALWIWDGAGGRNAVFVFETLRRLHLAQESGTMLGAAFLFAAIYAAVGLFGETVAPNPPRWAAPVATVPVLALAACYAEVGRLEADARWSLFGLILAVLLMFASYRALGRGDRPSAGVHAAGTIAGLALGFAMSLHDHWLSTALALTLPGLAFVETRVELPALRIVALVTGIVTFAILLWWLPYDLVYGHRIVAEHAFVTYAVPAAACASAAHLFRRRADDAVVACLEGGAMLAAALFVAIEVRLWFGHGELAEVLGFDEVVTLMLTTAAQAYAYHRVARRTRRRTVLIARGVFGCAAYAAGVGLLLADPLLTDARVGAPSLFFAYLLPALIAGVVARGAGDPQLRLVLNGYAVAALLSWSTAQVRQVFSPDHLSLLRWSVSEAEVWAWSGAWLVDGCVILGLGVTWRNQRLRLTGLALVGLVCVKVFLIDMAALTGLWRVASFLGLGLTLIGLSSIHRRFVLPARPADATG